MSTDGTTQVLDAGAPDARGREVASYVARVRAALADLGTEEVDDLTGGMEADLGELLAERGGPLERVLGAPTTYAEELRAAAGLPGAPATARTVDVGAWLRRRRDRVVALAHRWPWLRPVVDVLRSLRPAWWLVRGLFAAVTVVWVVRAGAIPSLEYYRGPIVVLGVTLAVVGVWLGRSRVVGDRSMSRRSAWTIVGDPVLTVAGLVGILVVLTTTAADPVYVGGDTVLTQTLSYEGRDIDNLYLYDANGQRLQDVRVLDDQGHLVLLSRTQDAADPDRTLPGVRDAQGQEWANVFPRPWTLGGAPYAPPPYGTTWSPPASIAPLATPTGGVTVTTTPTPASTTPVPAPTTTAPSTASSTTAPSTPGSSPTTR